MQTRKENHEGVLEARGVSERSPIDNAAHVDKKEMLCLTDTRGRDDKN